ncbi:MAG: histidine phosphatase family protein [Chloroflexota bacterium]
MLARHGESEWNGLGIYQGRLESDLSPLGRRQAEALAERLAGQKLAAIYSSPRRRSMQTAAIVAAGRVGPQPNGQTAPALGAPILADGDLTEIDHGAWSGLRRDEVRDRWPEVVAAWALHPTATAMPGGESLAQVRARTRAFLERARAAHERGNLQVNTHGTVLRRLLAAIRDRHPDRLWALGAENAGLSIIEDYEVPLITAINDTCHLKGVISNRDVQVR